MRLLQKAFTSADLYWYTGFLSRCCGYKSSKAPHVSLLLSLIRARLPQKSSSMTPSILIHSYWWLLFSLLAVHVHVCLKHGMHACTPASNIQLVNISNWLYHMCVCVCVCVLSCFSHVQLCRLYSTRLLCPWGSPGKNAGVDCQALLQGIFLTQGSLTSPSLSGGFFTVSSTWEAQPR